MRVRGGGVAGETRDLPCRTQRAGGIRARGEPQRHVESAPRGLDLDERRRVPRANDAAQPALGEAEIGPAPEEEPRGAVEIDGAANREALADDASPAHTPP